MYYNKRKLAISIMWIMIGVTLLILSFLGILENAIFPGLGGGWTVIGAIQIYRNVKYHTNESYKENIDINLTDERNRYIRMKAWSFAGYLFIIGAAIVGVVLLLTHYTLYGQIVLYCMCAVLVLYWISYMVLQYRE